jgi:hypothetical protein
MQSRATVLIRRNHTLPDNWSYYYLAYAVATAIYVGYSLMLLARWKRVNSRPRDRE